MKKIGFALFSVLIMSLMGLSVPRLVSADITTNSFYPVAGAPGTRVKICGTNFPTTIFNITFTTPFSYVTVTLCGVKAVINSVTSSLIDFTVPAMNRSLCSIKIGTSNGSATSASPFAVYSAPSALVIGVDPGAIAVDSTSVYWADGSGAVMKVGINGGAVTTLASEASDIELGTIAVDSTSVYWTAAGAVKKVGINGGAVTTLASGGRAYYIAVDSTSIYWEVIPTALEAT